MQKGQVLGVAIVLLKDDEIVFAKGYGPRLVGKNESLDNDNPFAIALISNYFTVTSLDLLVAKCGISNVGF